MKKLFAFVIAILIMIASIHVLAEGEHKSGLFTYTLKKNATATITGYDWDYSVLKIGKDNVNDIFIPPTLDGYTVTSIAENAFQFSYTEESHAQLDGGYNLNFILPDTIETIGKGAFVNCRIVGFNIPDSLVEIAYGAFMRENLGPYNIQFRISGNHSKYAVIDGALYDKTKKELIYAPVLSKYSETKLTIPEGILSIGDYAFYNNNGEGFKYDFLPSTLENIGDYAFYGCAGANIRIPNNVKTIGEHCFEMVYNNGYGDISLNFGETSITDIPDYAFYNPEPYPYKDSMVMSRIEIKMDNPQNIMSIGKNTCCGVIFTSASVFSPNVKTIPSGMFPVINELPDTVTTIESGAFYCAVTDFPLSSNLTSIAEDAFPLGSSFIVESGTYAERWADENGFAYTIEGQNNLDWLTGGDDGQSEEDTSWLGN